MLRTNWILIEPLKSDVKPLKIQVVALDWKWLFIYPEQGIATLNFVQFPAGTPIHFKLSADGSPMNSFWIPQIKRANLFHDRDDNAASHHGRRAGRIYRQSC